MTSRREFFPKRGPVGLALVCLLLLGVSPCRSEESNATPPPHGSTCADGLLAADESCTACPADGKGGACQPGTRRRSFDVRLRSPRGSVPVAATIRLAYRKGALGLPGTATSPELSKRLSGTPAGALVTASDLDDAVRVVVARSGGLGAGPLFTIEFDECTGAAAGVADLACVVEGCGSAGGVLTGCTCSITMQSPAAVTGTPSPGRREEPTAP